MGWRVPDFVDRDVVDTLGVGLWCLNQFCCPHYIFNPIMI